LILSCSDDETAKIWELASGDCVHTLRPHVGGVGSAILSPDDNLALTAPTPGLWQDGHDIANIWSVETGDCVHVLRGHTSWLRQACFFGGSAFVLTASDDHKAKIWNSETGTCTLTLHGHQDQVFSACVSSNNALALTASADKSAKIWCTQTGACKGTLRGHGDHVASALFFFGFCLGVNNFHGLLHQDLAREEQHVYTDSQMQWGACCIRSSE